MIIIGAGSVLIVSGKAEMAKSIASMMIREGFYPVNSANSANEARRIFLNILPDLVIISTPLPDEYGKDLVFDVRERTSAGILILARPEHLEDLQYGLEDTGALIIPKPVNSMTLLQTARFALSVRNSMNQLKSERDVLRKRIDERKVVEQAKWILVEKMNMNEPQASKYIQKKAMDLRLPQIKVAQEIIKEYE